MELGIYSFGDMPYDGSITQHQRLKDLVDEIAPGDYSSYAMDGNDTAVLGNWIYTYADAPATGGEVYRSNGKRTELVADIDEGTDYSSPDNFYTYRGWVYFSAAEDTNGNELWRTDGTTTTLVSDIRAGADGSNPQSFTALGTVSASAPYRADTDGERAEIFLPWRRDIAWHDAGEVPLEDLKGRPIYISTASNTTFWPWLAARYGYSDAQKRPYAFSVQPFLADRNASQQGYVTSEPYSIEKAGIKPAFGRG